MINIKALTREFTEKLGDFFWWVDELYPSKIAFPEWISPILTPSPYTNKNIFVKGTNFDLTENIDGLTIIFGYIKIGMFHNCVVYDKNGKQIPEMLNRFPKIKSALAKIQKDFNTDEITLQVKILENKNYYNVMPKVMAFALYLDGISQPLKEMSEILREFNIETVPVLSLSEEINEKTKEKYSAQSLLSNVPSKGIICTNRQKSLSFLL